jgi:hypothetical protein
MLAYPCRAQQETNVMTTVQTVMLETLRISDIDPISPETAPLVLTITVFNDDVPRDLSVRVNVTGERFGSLGFARKRLGPVAPHAVVTFTNRDFDSYNISMGADPLIDLALERGVLPADVYQFDVEVLDHTTLQRGVLVGTGKGFLETSNPGAQFDLLGPGTPFGQEPELIANPAPLFQWTSEARTFDFALYEVRPGQTSPEDVVTGRPVFSRDELTGNSFTYPNFAEALQPGMTYAWQLHARVLTSGGIERLPSPVYWFAMEAAAVPATHVADGTQPPPSPPPIATFEATPGVAPRLARIEIEPQEVTLVPGDLFQFRVTAYDTDGQVVVTFRPIWRLTPGFGGSMDDSGLFIAGERPGVVAVQVRQEDVSDFATVYIEAPERPVLLSEEAEDEGLLPVVDAPAPVDTAAMARADSLASPPDTTGAKVSPSDAAEGVQVYLLLPTPDQQVFEPSPTFVWNTAGADSSKVSRYRVSLWRTSLEQNPDVVPAEPPLWQGIVQESTILPYASETQVLAPSQYYVALVEALDADGEPLARSEPVRFFLSPQGKMGWELLQAWDEAVRQGQVDLSVTLLSELQTATLGNADRQRLLALEVQLEIEDGPWLQFSVPFRRLEEVAALEFIRILDLPAEPLLTDAGEAVSFPEVVAEPPEEPAALPASKATVRVAVMEFGFDEAAVRAMVTTQPLRFRSFRTNRQIGGSTPEQARHGAATLRALLDYLPRNTELYLLNFSTELEFRQALRYALDSLGVRVITCSVSWMNAYDHYDGSASLFNLDSWLGERAVLTTAAGNFARSHWEDPFNDSNGNQRHNFTLQQDYLELRLRNGVPYTFLLSWNDWQAPPRHDFDLSVLDGQGRALRFAQSGKPVRSANRQVAGEYMLPVERIRNFLPPYPGTQPYRLQIESPRLPNGLTPHLELYIYPAPEAALPAPMPGSSLSSGLATARSRSIIPVTATSYAAASQGPTNDNRERPDFAASGTVQLGATRLEGTSFATPRVAAAYALIFSQHPDWTATQATTFLRRFARPGNRQDPQMGWGAIAFDDLIAAL